VDGEWKMLFAVDPMFFWLLHKLIITDASYANLASIWQHLWKHKEREQVLRILLQDDRRGQLNLIP
jgi:hypothetical protein